MELIVWTNMGRSLLFKNVTNLQYHTQGIEFDYEGVSTGTKRHANLNNTCMLGYATSDKVESSVR